MSAEILNILMKRLGNLTLISVTETQIILQTSYDQYLISGPRAIDQRVGDKWITGTPGCLWLERVINGESLCQ